MKSLLCILLIFIALTCAQRTFHATSVTIRSIPNTIGSLSGDMYYDSTRALMQIEFVGLGVTEIYNFTDQVKYKKCSTTCDAESINYGDFGFYTPYPGESATSGFDCLTGGTKAAFSRPGTNFQVVRIAFNNADQVCRAQLGNGMEFVFNSFGTGVGAYDFSGCPKKQCSQKLDIMVVMDESGSIDNNEWQTMKDFANRFTQAFKVGTNAARIGLVAYSSSPALRFSYQTDEQSFRNTMNSLTRYFGGGSTYTNSALRTAYDAYVNAARKGSVKHITVVITDGFCTCDNNQIISSSAPLKQDTVGYVFAVGVDGARTSELNALASGTDGKININGKEVQTSFFVSQWSQLNGILDQLIAATCTEFQGNPCTGCNGYCSCGKTCVCPNDCSSFGDFCNNGVCNAGNGFACRSEPKTNPDPCDDNNLCTNEYCSSQSQSCVRSNVVCPDKPCFITSCNPASGCAYTAKDCTDSDPCTAEFCNVTLDACDYSVPKPCDACKNLKLNATTCSEGKSKCEKWDCVQTGTATAECQKLADVNCDDLNACTIDSCDSTTGVCNNVPRTDCVDTDACTIDSCDPVGGCQFLTVNETAYCDDLNACTIDSCNSTVGCVYENVTCNTTFPCQVSVCNPLNGCELQPKNCADEPGIRDQLGDCYAALCNDGSGLVANVSSDAKLGCYLDLQPGAKVDDCGVCKGDGTTCGFPLTIAEVAGISAAIIGAIVAGAAAFAIVGAVGAKKGYDAYMRNKNNMSGAQSNPMYNDNGRSGQNPMYEMK